MIPEGLQPFDHTGIRAGGFEAVLFIVCNKNLEAQAAIGLPCVGAKCVGNQFGSAMADVTCHGIERQGLPFHFLEHEIDRVHQVELRIDQGPVQVKKESANCWKIPISHRSPLYYAARRRLAFQYCQPREKKCGEMVLTSIE